MSTRGELIDKILGGLDREARSRVMGQLHAGVSPRIVGLEFGLDARLLRRLTPRRKHEAAETPGPVFDPTAAKQPDKWCERDPSKIVPLSRHGQTERARRAEQASRVDEILQASGMPPLSRLTPIIATVFRPDRALSDLRQDAGSKALFHPRGRDDHEQIPDIDHPPFGEGDR